ncbi:hypothetical protein D9756_002329 [Leucocoprinus leucothites]|uniref:ZW10 C-terminal helical domain-containing protein n=1 Tax=Leucocoprinus leucothites TaxID=201217 RepID=A0A8H5GCJ2_9AGAR|nr:hypothetical protein D9756_002329 [Leucoagaricus leucothites]
MAFPIPTHLPRKQDVSSRILNKIDSATHQTLDSTLTSTWLNELDETIQITKTRLHECIQSDLPQFQRQWESAKSIQTRLQTLTSNVDTLDVTVSDLKSGLVPVLLQRLSEHSKLVQEAADIQSRYQALSHMLQCKTGFSNLDNLVKAGKLPEAVVVLKGLHTLLESSPEPLAQSKIFSEFRRKHQSTQALVQEQLSDAYTRSIVISASTLVVRSSVQVRGSDTVLSLPSILFSLAPNSLDQHLATLRRDIITHFIEYVLRQPSSVSLNTIGDTEYSISLMPAPPNSETKSNRIENLSQILSFLSSRIFPFLPSPVSSSFPQSLFKPTTTSLLNVLLVPSLPSSFGLLPPFLELAKRAVTFESDVVTRLEGSSAAELPIRTWVDGLTVHYERQRRLELLGNCRTIILSQEDSKDCFMFEMEVKSESTRATVVPVQDDGVETIDDNEFRDDAWGFDDEAEGGKPMPVENQKIPEPVPVQREEDDYQDDAWGLDDENTVEEEQPQIPTHAAAHTEFIPTEDGDNGWELNDDDLPGTNSEPSLLAASQSTESDNPSGNPEPDPGDAWGWNDDTEVTGNDSNWDDDPWANAPAVDEPVAEKPAVRKAATGLQKIVNKAKKPVNGHTSVASATPSPAPLHAPPPPPPNLHSANGYTSHADNAWRDSTPAPAPVPVKRPPELKILAKESFTVPDKARRIIKAVENLIEECKQFQASSLFPLYPSITSSTSSSQPGAILSQTPLSLVDLYIAMYPVKFGKYLLDSAQNGMLFSNSCLYLAHELGKIEKSLGRSGGFEGLKEKLEECGKNLTVVGESWYEQVVQTQCEKVDDLLVEGAKGFAYTSSQERYDECEAAIGQAVQEIKRFGRQLKSILTKGKYYTAIGLVTEAALSRILQDILALSDIPEVDSHRLSELCRILNSLEGLFSQDPEQPSFVVAYVPSWLKFNYLSELLEASMADISYLFEEGALVDFEIDELVRLVKALFADTALRTNTINKLMEGHPVSS